MSSSPPSTLGKYQIIREIARSNDIVYEAYDPLMNRRVALKELALPGGSTPQQRDDRVSRFKREAQAAGTLNHPNIMTVYELGQEGERFYMAMEFLDGHTLRNEVDTRGLIPADRAVELALAVLAGLEHAHNKGVIHRDIKPDNIQILSNGEVKITDFGIARLTFQPNLTMDGQVFGTPSYMSPEQVVGKEIDARSDLFSVGVVLYEMLAGQKPFAGDSVVTITYAIMNKTPDMLPQVNYALWQVIEKALDKSPQLRFRNAHEMTLALEAVQRQLSGGVVVDPSPTPGFSMPGASPVGPAPAPMNPYAAAPPTMAPGAPPPPGTPIYVPYGQNPAGSPPGAQPAPPPILYPYNPYQHPQAGGAPPHTPQMQPIPIFYPPPPRAPMLKPETRAFLGRLMVATVLIGTLLALFLVALNSALGAYQRYQREQQDRVRVGAPQPVVAGVNLENQIAEREQNKTRLTSPDRIAEENRALAQMRVLLARRYMQTADFINAENTLNEAREMDPRNPEVYGGLGELYGHLAQREPIATRRVELWQRSADQWIQGVDLTPNPASATLMRTGAADASLEAAHQMLRHGLGDRVAIRSRLYDARDYAVPGSEQLREAEELLRELTGTAIRSQ